MSNINFSSLGGDSSNRAVKVTSFDQAKFVLYFLLIFPTFIFIALIFLISPVFFLGILVILAIYSNRKNKKAKIKQSDIYEKLAIDNNWQFNVPITDEFSTGFLLPGINYKDLKGIKGVVANKEFFLGYDIGGGVAIINAGKTLPEAFFMSAMVNSPIIRNGFNRLMEEEGLEHLSLEGDFDRSLVLYARPENRIDVLSVVAPDFMMSLLEKGSVAGVAMKGSNITLASYSPSPEHIRDLLEITEAIAKELR